MHPTKGATMKLLLSMLLAATLVILPAPAEAKRKPSSCTGIQTTEYKHDRKIVTTYMSCPQKNRRAQLYVPFSVWG